MKWNQKQEAEIYNFTQQYFKDQTFAQTYQQLYDKKPYQLSILQIYALEHILRYGTKDIYNRALEVMDDVSEEQMIELYESFLSLLNHNADFRQYKMQQFQETPQSLSSIERFIFQFILHSYEQENRQSSTLEYDPYTPILYSNDKEIRTTLENLLFGELIHKMLNLPEMQGIKAQQKMPGRIANTDKQIIIERIQTFISQPGIINQMQQTIDQRYARVKMSLLLGNGMNSFEPYAAYNTNISAQEIVPINAATFYQNTGDMIEELLKGIFEKRKGKK